MDFLANFQWWLIFLVGFAGYFIYSFGQKTSGALFNETRKLILINVGGFIYLATLIGFFIVFGIKIGILSSIISFLLCGSVVGILWALVFKH